MFFPLIIQWEKARKVCAFWNNSVKKVICEMVNQTLALEIYKCYLFVLEVPIKYLDFWTLEPIGFGVHAH